LYRFPRHFVFVDNQLRNKPSIFKTLVRFDVTCGTIIISMYIRQLEYLFICLSVLKSDQVLISLNFVWNSHRRWVAISKYLLFAILNPRMPYFKRNVSIILVHTKLRVVGYTMSQRVLNILEMLWWSICLWFRLLYFCFKQWHWTGYTFPFGFRFKTRLATARFYSGNGDGFPFFFLGFQVWVLMQTNFGPFVIAVILSSIFLTALRRLFPTLGPFSLRRWQLSAAHSPWWWNKG